MKTKSYLLLFSILCFSWNTVSSMEEKRRRIQNDDNELQKAPPPLKQFEMPSLFKLSIGALLQQKPRQLSLQLEQYAYALPEEIRIPIVHHALSTHQKKRMLITLFKHLPLPSKAYDDIAVDIAYAQKNNHLKLQDKFHLLCALREIQHPRKKTKKILNTLRAALNEALKESSKCKGHLYAQPDSSLTIFEYSFRNQKSPSKIVKLLLKHGSPHDTSELIGGFVKTCDLIYPKYYNRFLRKLSLLVNAHIPLCNEVFESKQVTIDGGIYTETIPFSNPYEYLQTKLTSIFDEEARGIIYKENEEKKLFYFDVKELIKPRYTP